MRKFAPRYARIGPEGEPDVELITISPRDCDEGELYLTFGNLEETELYHSFDISREEVRAFRDQLSAWLEFEDSMLEHESEGELPRWRVRELVEAQTGEVE